MHMRLMVTKGAGRKDEEYFVANQSRGEILIGLDLIPQEGQASQQVWKSRQKKATVPATASRGADSRSAATESTRAY